MEKQKLNGTILIFIGSEGTTIEIEDREANTRFVKIELTVEQLSMALSSQSYVPCKIEVSGLDIVGKKHECESFEFEIPNNLASSKYEDELQKIAQSKLKDGWIAERYFSSQNSFFKKEDKQYARCTIRRYI